MIGLRSTDLLLPSLSPERLSTEPDFASYKTNNINEPPSKRDMGATKSEIIFQEQEGNDGEVGVVLAAATIEKLMDWLLLSEGNTTESLTNI